MTSTAVGTSEPDDLPGQVAQLSANLAQVMEAVRQMQAIRCGCGTPPMCTTWYPTVTTTTAIQPSIIWQSTVSTG